MRMGERSPPRYRNRSRGRWKRNLTKRRIRRYFTVMLAVLIMTMRSWPPPDRVEYEETDGNRDEERKDRPGQNGDRSLTYSSWNRWRPS
jgi:hypothetical protein